MGHSSFRMSSTFSIRYDCQRCTACCRWPGFVNVNDAEIGEIARFLSIEADEFIRRYTRLRPHRDGLALIDKRGSHECIFLEGRDCAIQPVKPAQCREFPNTWNFPGWREQCEAAPRLVNVGP
jgi:hypothetical protein